VFDWIKKYGFYLLAVLTIAGCSDTDNADKTAVAEVGDQKLYSTDVNEIIPSGLEKEDSLAMAADYIRKWVKQELLIQKAEENLTYEQKNVTKELEEYRNSLIIYKYKNELMKQRMDTTVTDDQISDYYLEHSENFNLSRNIVKAIYIKIPKEYANRAQLKELCSNTTEEGLTELREYCLQYAKGFDIFMDNWVDFEIVVKNIPKEIDDPEHFLQQNKWIELEDSNYYYIVSIQDFKLKNEEAPMEYVKDNIKNLILNRRKIAFLKQVEDNVYKEGIRKNKFKIYNQETNEEN
jgi:hypothetical protein